MVFRLLRNVRTRLQIYSHMSDIRSLRLLVIICQFVYHLLSVDTHFQGLTLRGAKIA